MHKKFDPQILTRPDLFGLSAEKTARVLQVEKTTVFRYRAILRDLGIAYK